MVLGVEVESLQVACHSQIPPLYGKDGKLAADREGSELAVAAGYFTARSSGTLRGISILISPCTTSTPRKDAPSMGERVRQVKVE